jgi:hypothetical protein
MPIAWFVCGFWTQVKSYVGPLKAIREPTIIKNFAKTVQDEGGKMAYTEVLGDTAVFKVMANQATLDAIAVSSGVFKFPLNILNGTLVSLTTAQRTAIRNRLIQMGYPDIEITADLGSNIRTKTLGDILRFAAKRRLKPRWDADTQSVKIDGTVQECTPISYVDGKVTE